MKLNNNFRKIELSNPNERNTAFNYLKKGDLFQVLKRSIKASEFDNKVSNFSFWVPFMIFGVFQILATGFWYWNVEKVDAGSDHSSLRNAPKVFSVW